MCVPLFCVNELFKNATHYLLPPFLLLLNGNVYQELMVTKKEIVKESLDS